MLLSKNSLFVFFSLLIFDEMIELTLLMHKFVQSVSDSLSINLFQEQPPGVLTYTLPLKWKEVTAMPSRLGVRDGRAVAVGSQVFVAVGEGSKGSQFQILIYSIQQNEWRYVKTPVQRFGLAVVRDDVFIVSGEDKEFTASGNVLKLTNNNDWVRHFPPHAYGKKVVLSGGLQQVVTGGGGRG